MFTMYYITNYLNLFYDDKNYLKCINALMIEISVLGNRVLDTGRIFGALWKKLRAVNSS